MDKVNPSNFQFQFTQRSSCQLSMIIVINEPTRLPSSRMSPNYARAMSPRQRNRGCGLGTSLTRAWLPANVCRDRKFSSYFPCSETKSRGELNHDPRDFFLILSRIDSLDDRRRIDAERPRVST